jgi:hypothetical protein
VPPGHPADANCDGRLDVQDQRAVIASIFTRAATCNADCNRDGEVTGTDLVCITHYRMAAAGSVAGRFIRAGQSRPGGRRR